MVDWSAIWDQIRVEWSSWVQSFGDDLPSYIAAVIVLLGFFVAAKLVEVGVRKALRRTVGSQQMARYSAKIAKIVVVLVGLAVALAVAELDKTVTSLLAGAGIVGLALGFAFQDIAVNFIAGGSILSRKPFTPGEIIETNGFLGNVQEVSLRNTIIRTFDGQRVLIPNKMIFENPLINYSRDPERRVDLACGVSYAADLEEVLRVAKRAVESLEARDTNKPVEVFYEEFGASSINLTVRFWTAFGQKQSDFLKARSDAVVALKHAFDDAGITIPFPIRTLDFGREGKDSLSEALGNLSDSAH